MLSSQTGTDNYNSQPFIGAVVSVYCTVPVLFGQNGPLFWDFADSNGSYPWMLEAPAIKQEYLSVTDAGKSAQSTQQ